MNKKTGLFAFLAGALIGSAASLLYAPRSGEETRKLISENSQEVKDRAMKSIQEVKDSASTVIDDTLASVQAFDKEIRGKIAELKNTDFIRKEEKQAQEQPESEEIQEAQAA